MLPCLPWAEPVDAFIPPFEFVFVFELVPSVDPDERELRLWSLLFFSLPVIRASIVRFRKFSFVP